MNEITISLTDLILFLLGAGGIVLIIFLIIMVRHLIVTLKSTNLVLQDLQIISEIAAKRTKDLDGIIADVAESVETVTKNVKGNTSIVKTLSSAVGFLSSLKGLFSKNDKKKDTD